MACQSRQRLLMVLLLTILTSLVTAAPVTEESITTEATEGKFSDVENTLDGLLSELQEVLNDLDDNSSNSNNSHHHLLRTAADILEEIQTNIPDFLNENFRELTHNHTLTGKVSCGLETEEYENASLSELCQKFSAAAISYTVKADVDCTLSSLFLMNSYLQSLISFHGSLFPEKLAALSDMLNKLAKHFQNFKEDISEKIESSCKNYTAAMDVSKIEIPNGNGVNETSNMTEVAETSNMTEVAGEILSEEDKEKKQEEIFKEEKKTIGEIKTDLLHINGLVKKFESEEKEAELLAGHLNVTSPVQSNITDGIIPNVNAEANVSSVVESNDTLPAGSSFTNLTESNVGAAVDSNDRLPAGSDFTNLTESNVGAAVDSNDTLPAGSDFTNLTESNVVDAGKPNAGAAVDSNDTLPAGSDFTNLTESNVVDAGKPNAGVAVDSNDTLPAGSDFTNLTESNVVDAGKPNAGVAVVSNDTLPAGSDFTNLTESNVVNAEEPNVTVTGNDVEKNDSDESMLKILKSNTEMFNNATNENEDAFIDKVKDSLGNKGELPTTKETSEEDEVEEILKKLF